MREKIISTLFLCMVLAVAAEAGGITDYDLNREGYIDIGDSVKIEGEFAGSTGYLDLAVESRIIDLKLSWRQSCCASRTYPEASGWLASA